MSGRWASLKREMLLDHHSIALWASSSSSFSHTSSYNDTATTCYLLKCKRSVLWHAQFLRCSNSMSGAGGKGRRKIGKDKIVQRWQTQRHDWKSLGQCRMQAFIWWIRKVADELRVNYLQVQGWIDRNVGAGKQQLPSSLFFLPFLPFPPFSFFLLLKFIRLLTEQLAFSTFGILLVLQAASILDLQI